MKALYQSLLLTIGALAVAGTAYAQVPVGTWSGNDTSDPSDNTGMGTGALGSAASNGGGGNTASGAYALHSNTTGFYNTASGYDALLFNMTGSYNTATGWQALDNNDNGSSNTATGTYALYSNIGGTGNEGSYNTASGYQALYTNSSGVGNTASGVTALYANVGSYNTADGLGALYHNSSGGHNIGVGYQAGLNLTKGSNNIDIGSPGVAAESGVIRIGTITGTTSTQSATYIAGIYGVPVAGAYVCADSNGQLGTNATSCATPSSRRYKEDIRPMAEASDRLLKLQPVTFRYKNPDAAGNKSIQYGLIAEDVAEVFPELVVFNKDGQPDAVMYQALTPMLLNELQKQAAEIHDLKQQQKQFVEQAAQLRDVQRQLADLHAALAKLQSRDELVAQR